MNLFDLPRSEEESIKFLQERNTKRLSFRVHGAEEMKADGDDPFDSILQKIAAYWPPEEQL